LVFGLVCLARYELHDNETAGGRSMPASQRTVQICLFILAAIGLFGGCLQMSLGQPDTTPRLDNVHRFLAGIYLGCGIIALWAAVTVRRHGTLIYLLALGVSLGTPTFITEMIRPSWSCR
jgi:hypothetical protein